MMKEHFKIFPQVEMSADAVAVLMDAPSHSWQHSFSALISWFMTYIHIVLWDGMDL